MAALANRTEVVKTNHKAADRSDPAEDKEAVLAKRTVAVKTDHKTADRADPVEDKEAALANRTVVVKTDHKTADRSDPAEDKEAVLANRTDSSRLTEEEAQKAYRVTFQIIKIQEEEEAETSTIRNNMVGKTTLGIMAHGKEDNIHRITKVGEVMIAKAITKKVRCIHDNKKVICYDKQGYYKKTKLK